MFIKEIYLTLTQKEFIPKEFGALNFSLSHTVHHISVVKNEQNEKLNLIVFV